MVTMYHHAHPPKRCDDAMNSLFGQIPKIQNDANGTQLATNF